MDLRIFLPFTINLDPYLRKVLKEDQQALEDDGIVIPIIAPSRTNNIKTPSVTVTQNNVHRPAPVYHQQPASRVQYSQYPPPQPPASSDYGFKPNVIYEEQRAYPNSAIDLVINVEFVFDKTLYSSSSNFRISQT